MAWRHRCRCRAGVRHRRRSAAHVRRCVCPRRCRGLTEGVTACAVGLRLWSSGVPPARRQQGRVKSRHAAFRSAYRVMAECRRSATMCADVGGDGVTRPLARSGWRRCSGAGIVSVEDEVRRADPLSVNPGQRVRGERMMRYAPHGGAAVDAVPGCASGGAPRRICIGCCAPDSVGG